MSWNFPENIKQNTSLSLAATRELLVSAYTDDQAKWSNDISVLEKSLVEKEKEIYELEKVDYSWAEKLFKKFGVKIEKDKKLSELKLELEEVKIKYEKKVSEAPNLDRYELAMWGGIFKTR